MHLSAVALGLTPETPLGIRWDLVDFGLEFRPGGIYSNNLKKVYTKLNYNWFVTNTTSPLLVF